MKSTSLYLFIALGALLISHTSAAPTSGLVKLGKELLKFLLSSNEQAEVETSDSDGNQVDALIQVLFDGMNELLAIEEQYNGRSQGNGRRGRRNGSHGHGYGSRGSYDTLDDSINS